MNEQTKPDCPRCKNNENVVALISSLGSTPNVAELLAGGAFLGGCIIHPGSPKWHCTYCGTDFGHQEEDQG